MLAAIKEFCTEFFEKIWIDFTDLEVRSEWEDIFFVKLETTDSGILIWKHWTVFESIQSLLRNIISNKYDKKIKIHLDINDYIHNKDEKLFSSIDSKIEYAKKVSRNMKLPVLTAYERKKVHSYIADLWDEDIRTESRWEWKDIRLFIVLTNNEYKKEKTREKLDIDIDWDDI